MMYFSSTSRFATGLCIFVFCLLSGLVIDTASAADAYYDGNLGDTIDLHGVSYTGTQVYLFMTGPNLPANGVTLTDITQRADQGHFTTIDLNSNQEWSFKWDTARIQQLIDPGTYTVYITTEPEDLSHLGGTSTYKTLSVYLQDAGIPQGSSEPGTYTLNPEKHRSTISAVPSMIIATPAPTPNLTTLATSATTVITVPTTSLPSSPSPTKAEIPSVISVIAVIFVAGLIVFRRSF